MSILSYFKASPLPTPKETGIGASTIYQGGESSGLPCTVKKLAYYINTVEGRLDDLPVQSADLELEEDSFWDLEDWYDIMCSSTIMADFYGNTYKCVTTAYIGELLYTGASFQ